MEARNQVAGALVRSRFFSTNHMPSVVDLASVNSVPGGILVAQTFSLRVLGTFQSPDSNERQDTELESSVNPQQECLRYASTLRR